MDRNEKRDRIRGQIRTLEAFYKNLQTWDVSNIGAWLVAGILVPIATVIYWIPCQEMNADERGLYYLMFSYILMIGQFMYLRPYLMISENRKMKRISEKLQYLPVSRAGLFLFVVKKLSRMVLLAGSVQLIGQCVTAYAFYARIELCNVLLPLLTGVALPGGVNLLFTMLACYERGQRDR